MSNNRNNPKDTVSADIIQFININKNRILESVREYETLCSIFSEEEKLYRKNLIAQDIGISCELYLKALRLKSVNISYKDEIKNLLKNECANLNIGDELTDQEEIALLTGETIETLRKAQLLNTPPYARLKLLSQKQIVINGKKQNALKQLIEDQKTRKNSFLSVSHDLSQNVMQGNSQLPKPFVILASINYAMNNTKSDSDKKPTRQDLIEACEVINGSLPALNVDNFFIKNGGVFESVKDLNTSEVKDAFPKSRYSIIHSDNSLYYEPNLEFLENFYKILDAMLPLYMNVVDLGLDTTTIPISPDLNSIIQLYNENNELIGALLASSGPDIRQDKSNENEFFKSKVKTKLTPLSDFTDQGGPSNIAIQNYIDLRELSGDKHSRCTVKYKRNGEDKYLVCIRSKHFHSEGFIDIKQTERGLYPDAVENQEKLQRLESIIKENESLKNKNIELTKENESLKNKNIELTKILERILKKLDKALSFIKEVKNSSIGKLFFRKGLKSLDEDSDKLQSGDNERE